MITNSKSTIGYIKKGIFEEVHIKLCLYYVFSKNFMG